MKICVSLRDPAPQNLRSGNLRSESRWERQALEACVLNNEVTDIYTLGHEWAGGKSVTRKYRGVLNNSSPRDCVLLMQDWNINVVNSHRFKALIVNIFSGPWIQQKQEISDVIRSYNNNVFFTMGFPVLYAQEVSVLSKDLPFISKEGRKRFRTLDPNSHLENFIDLDKIRLLPVPGIPESEFEDNFDKNNILWVSRLVFLNDMEKNFSLNWALEKLQENENLRLEILTGWEVHEVKNYENNTVIKINEEINDAFWRLPGFQKFISLRNRVSVFCSLHWHEVLQKYSQAKILSTVGKHYGGPPLEASMHGVPFVGVGDYGALGDCEGYLYSPDQAGAINLLNKLISDRDFYHEKAKLYNEYAVRLYSYKSFNENLNKLLQEEGLL